MLLLVFDVDGTLTETNEIDEVCFVRAVEEVLRIHVSTDWMTYRHVTDSCILAELVESNFGRPPTRTEQERVHTRFCGQLETAFTADRDVCLPIEGGPAIFNQLGAWDDLAIAVATGGWERSARLKLRRAGYQADDVLLASASDALSRREIMLLVEERARARCGITAFESITYVGDAPWDYHAVMELGWRFIGIARGRSARVLKRLGLTTILADFRAPLLFERWL